MITIRRNRPILETELPESLAKDLGTLYLAKAPRKEFDVSLAASTSLAAQGSPSRLRPLGMAAGAAAIAAAAALAAVPQFTGDGPEQVSAAELLEKSRAAVEQLAQGEKSYYIERYSVIDGGTKPGDIQVSRLWSQDDEHWRWEFDMIDPATGEPAPGTESGNIRNGDEFWMIHQDGEILRVINRSVAAMGFENVGFSPGATLGETLEAFKICDGGSTVSEGEAVAGRPTIRVDCAAKSSSVWLDSQSFVPLKHESTGMMSISSTTLAINFDAIPDDVFDYKPPSGTWVNYQDRGEVIEVP